MLIPLVLAVGVVPVRISGSPDHWQLLRDGKPYYIRGAGGTSHLDVLAASGGNSIRTWGIDQLPGVLPAVHQNGLTITVGLWLQHADGLNYNDEAKVAQQAAQVGADVAKYKDDPAVLMWGVGNEMEGGNDTPALWRGVEAACRAAKDADSQHPVMTVVAEISQEKIDHILKYAPDVDVLGVNSYGGIMSVAKRLKEYGWTKPYVVTEFGPLGHWECGKTSWGAPIEATSTEKAAHYQDGYDASIGSQPGWCLGSYAFLWGNKQEATPTWFSMFLPSGEPVEPVDVMQKEWTGQWPATRAPKISGFILGGDHDGVTAGATLKALVKAEGESLTYRWEVRPEVGQRRADGIGEADPQPTEVAFSPADGPKVAFKAPNRPGAYRLYVYVYASAKRVATGNIPFRVQ